MAIEEQLQDQARKLALEEDLAREKEKLRATAWMNLAAAMVTVGIFTPGITLVLGMTAATLPTSEVASVMAGCAIFGLYLYSRALEALNRGHER